MATLKQKRKYVMDYVCGMYDRLDPSGTNSKIFREKWGPLSDTEFSKKFEEFLRDDTRKGFYLEVVEFERDLTLENIMNCAKAMNIPLWERVALPHINGSLEDAVVTPEPVPVGFIHAKRMPQMLLEKNAGSISINKRNALSGQVTGDDKNGVTSNVETYSMVASGATTALKELLGPRADNMAAKNQMYNAINRDGYVSLDELPNDPEDKVAINSLDAYFTMQGFRTNLVKKDGSIPHPEEEMTI